MSNPPIKRDPALVSFSRDHHVGLSLARELRLAGEGRSDPIAAWSRFQQAWRDELADHFDEEERLLIPLTRDPALADRLRHEHDALRAEARAPQPDAAALARIGELLHDHIRWEEREYFPAVEAVLTDASRAALARETARLEARRPRSCGINPQPDHPVHPARRAD